MYQALCAEEENAYQKHLKNPGGRSSTKPKINVGRTALCLHEQRSQSIYVLTINWPLLRLNELIRSKIVLIEQISSLTRDRVSFQRLKDWYY